MIKEHSSGIKMSVFLIFMSMLLPIGASASSDVLVWQGQYYTGNTFNQGTYKFVFTVYDAPVAGNMCFNSTERLTTGHWGEWNTEQSGVGLACNNASSDYYLNINIAGVDQTPRRRLVVWNFLRKNVNETSSGSIETDIVKLGVGLKELNIDIPRSKLNYARELAESTLISQQEVALSEINKARNLSLVIVGESIELKKSRVITASDFAIKLIAANLRIANAKILEAKKLVLLYNEKPEDAAMIEKEAALHLITLNSAAERLRVLVERAVNDSLAQINADDNGKRFAIKDADGSLNLNSGNITTTRTGFFGWVGSLISRVTKLFVRDIDFNGNINGTGNITTTGKISTLDGIQGNYYSANGSQGITNTASYRVCTSLAANNCNSWCTLKIINGLITGCT